MSGLEMGNGPVPFRNYGVPTPPFAGELPGSIQLMRVPFRMSRVWQNGALDPRYVGFLQAIGDWCIGHGVVPIFDDHEYGTTAGADIAAAPGAAALLAEWRGLVGSLPAGAAIDLMNEPKNQPNAALVATYNAVIAAVRAAGFAGTIFVEPDRYARAAQVSATWSDFDGITDPAHRTDLEVHWYLDPGDTGNGRDPASLTDAARVMGNIVAFQRSGHSPFGRVLLGETGVGQVGGVVDAAQAAALTSALDVIAAHPGVFYGVALWAAGPWWPPKYPLDENAGSSGGFRLAEEVFEPLAIHLSEDADAGDAVAAIALDGTPVWAGAVTADRLDAAPLAVAIPGSAALEAGTHRISVTFRNPSGRRRLFVDGISWRGTAATARGFLPVDGPGAVSIPVTLR